MRKLFLLLPALAFSQTVRVPSGGFCDITTVSTSGVITYAAGGSCAPAEGQVINIQGVRAGNNMHPVNSRADSNHRWRKIKAGTLNLVARTFQVTDMADVDVANTPPGGGSALSGTLGFFGAVSSPYTVRSSKGGWLDGPGGAKTLNLANAAKKAGTPYTALTNMVNGYKTWRTVTAPNAWGGTDYNLTERHSATLGSIIKYLADSTDTVARDVAVADLKGGNITSAIGSASCDETVVNCGLPASGYADYSPSNFALWQALAATYVEGETGWGSTDRERLSRFWLNDLCWYEGGLADTSHCTGQSPGPYNKVAWKIHSVAGASDYTHGTTPATLAGNSTVNITGGNLIADGVTVGDIIFFPHPAESNYSQAYKIASLTSTSVTLTVPLRENIPNQHYAVGRDWSDGDMGMAFQRNHFGSGYQYGCGTCFYYPPQSGVLDVTHNLPLTRMMGEAATGLYACGSNNDQIGCYAAERALFWYYHLYLREILMTNSNGFNSTKFFYNEWRMNAAHGMVITFIKNWLVGGPDWNYGNLLEGMSSQWRHMYYPGRGIGPWMPYTAEYLAQYYMTPLFNMYNSPSSTEAQYAQHAIQTVVGGYTSGKIGSNTGSYAHWHYLLYDPTISSTAAPTGSIGRNYIAECRSIWSTSQCTDTSRTVFTSRTGWGTSDSIGMMVAASIAGADQQDQSGTSQVTLWKNGTPLIWGDNSVGYGLIGGSGSILQIGSPGMVRAVYPGTVPIPWQSTSSIHTYGRAILDATYNAASNVTLAERQWARVGEVYFVHDRATTSSAQAFRSRYHPAINSCGTVTSSPCIAVDLSARTITSAYPQVSPTTGLGFIAVPVGGSTIAMTKESGVAGNLSYTGGAGISGRVEVCSSSNGTTCADATSYEAAAVMVPTSGSGSAPSVTTSTVGSHRIIEVASPSAAVAALTAGGATASSLTFTTSHSGSAPYLVAGLPAGTYAVTRNGSAVSGSPFTVTSGEGSLSFSSTSGAIALADTGAPPPPSGAGATVRGGRPRGGIIR